MRTILNLNKSWLFTKNTNDIALRTGEAIDLPHCWNAVDGQDGGNDYFRGDCLYVKTLRKAELPEADRYYLEIQGANSSAEVFVGGESLAVHHGGYSTWRVDLTDKLADETDIAIVVNNAANETVYPQMADFTFYGGIYRDVNLICVNESHFDLDFYGAPGIKVTPVMDGDNANVEVEVFVTNPKDGQEISYTITDKEGNLVAQTVTAIPRSASPSKMPTSGTVVRTPTSTPPRLFCWQMALPSTMCLPASAAAASGSTPTTASYSTARSTLCAVFPVTRTAGALVTHCCVSTTKRMSS